MRPARHPLRAAFRHNPARNPPGLPRPAISRCPVPRCAPPPIGGNRTRPVSRGNAPPRTNQGPKLGEQGHFRRAAESGNNGDLSYALRRFDNESHRIYGVMNLGLFNKRYLAAGAYTIADMICYPWASSWASRKIDIDEFPNVKRC